MVLGSDQHEKNRPSTDVLTRSDVSANFGSLFHEIAHRSPYIAGMLFLPILA